MISTQFDQISRRGFLKATGIASSSTCIYAISGCSPSFTDSAPNKSGPSPELFLELDGRQIRFILPRSEMGQDIATSFAIILSEEMAAPLDLIKIKFADANSRLGSQMTVGSTSVRTWWNPLRQLGNRIKYLAINAAATRWSASASECKIAEGRVVHLPSGRSDSYVSALRFAISPKQSTENTEDTLLASGPLSEPSAFKLIGRNTKSILAHEKIVGSFNFVGDVVDEQLLTAMTVLYKSSWLMPTQKQIDHLKQQYSLTDAFVLDHTLSGYQFRVVLVNDKTWPLLKAKNELAFALREWLVKNTQDEPSAFEKFVSEQNREAVVDKQTLSLSFYTPYVAHTPMETQTAIAEYDDQHCEIWAPTQAPMKARNKIAETLERDISFVTLHTAPIGGSFGRKRYDDFVIETVLISRSLHQRNRPSKVKLLWTREDDLEREFYRPATSQKFTWSQSTSESIQHTLIEAQHPDVQSSENHTNSFPFMDWQLNTHITHVPGHHIPGIWRSVRHGYLAFGLGSFMDELSRQQNRDPIEFYRSHIKNESIIERVKNTLKPSTRYESARAHEVIRQVKINSRWGSEVDQNEASGFSAYTCLNSYIAVVVKISVKNNVLKIDKIWAAVDVGTAINLGGIRAQIEGGILFGLSACLYSEIPLNPYKKALNFNQYQVIRMADSPAIDVHIITSEQHPSGAGELGVPVIAPALANAIRSATGLRMLRMPFLKDGELNHSHAIKT